MTNGKFKQLVTILASVMMFIGLHAKLEQMGVVDKYWWVIFLTGIFMFTYLAKKIDGKNIGGFL